MSDTPHEHVIHSQGPVQNMFPDLDKDITPETCNEHIRMSIMLPFGSQMIYNTIVAKKHEQVASW